MHLHSSLACEMWVDVVKRVLMRWPVHIYSMMWRVNGVSLTCLQLVTQWWTRSTSELLVFCSCHGARITCPSPLTQLQEWCCHQTDTHLSFPTWGLMMLVTINVLPPTELVAMSVTSISVCWVSSFFFRKKGSGCRKRKVNDERFLQLKMQDFWELSLCSWKSSSQYFERWQCHDRNDHAAQGASCSWTAWPVIPLA